MARLSVAQGPCSAVLPTVHGCHYAFQKFPFFCVTLYQATEAGINHTTVTNKQMCQFFSRDVAAFIFGVTADEKKE